MKRLLMALVVAVMLIGPASNAASVKAYQLKACTSVPRIVDMQNAYAKAGNYCGKAIDFMIKNQCPTNQTITLPKPTAATPKPAATQAPKPAATATAKPAATQAPKPAATATPKPAATATPKPPSGNTNSISAFERQVADLVNKERAANGLAPLTLNAKLSNVARVKSQDMHDKHYFSHTSPTYGSPFDMLKTFGISYRTAGENIAYGYSSPQAVMDGWMNSPGHRANILNASYTQIGVGYVADGNYWTQEFIG